MFIIIYRNGTKLVLSSQVARAKMQVIRQATLVSTADLRRSNPFKHEPILKGFCEEIKQL